MAVFLSRSTGYQEDAGSGTECVSRGIHHSLTYVVLGIQEAIRHSTGFSYFKKRSVLKKPEGI